MNFKTEKDLVITLREVIENSFKSKSIKITEEVSLGFGIADMVVSNLKSFDLRTKTPHNLNLSDINIFTLIELKENLKFDEILEITRISKFNLNSALERLIKRKLVVKKKNENYSINKKFDLTFEANYAIEAKLKDWKRALQQAYRYQWFAEYSFVVMDEHYCNPAIENKKMFEKYNIGLASINTKGELKRIFTPNRQRPYDITMQRLFSEMLRDLPVY